MHLAEPGVTGPINNNVAVNCLLTSSGLSHSSAESLSLCCGCRGVSKHFAYLVNLMVIREGNEHFLLNFGYKIWEFFPTLITRFDR